MKCLMCDSKQIVHNVRVVDRTHHHSKRNLTLEVYEDPDAIIFKGTYPADLWANICEDCGFVMLTIQPEKAKELRQHQNTRK